jgi:hypothetical protein
MPRSSVDPKKRKDTPAGIAAEGEKRARPRDIPGVHSVGVEGATTADRLFVFQLGQP